MTTDESQEKFARPAWNQAGMWMGVEFFGLYRLLRFNRFQVRLRYVPDCLIDLAFGGGNTLLGGLQSAVYGRRLERVEFEPPPLFVLGHWRTGTTLFHELLASDPRHAAPTTYQCFLPHHFLLTERWVKRWTGFALPSRRPPDQVRMGWDRPQEDEFAICCRGAPSIYSNIAFPNHAFQQLESLEVDGLNDVDRERWRRGWLQFLRAVQLRHHEQRLIIKSPTHTFRLPQIHDAFPQARYVVMVRNPYDVFPSTVRLWKSLFASHGYQTPTFEGIDEFVFDTFLQMHERLLATRERIFEQRMHVIRYEDLIANPIDVLRGVYEALTLGDFTCVESRFREYFEEHADYQTNKHELTSELRAEIYERWRPYFEEYGYEK